MPNNCTFDHNSFAEAFEADLDRARISVLIQSPFISSRGVARITKKFSDLTNRGVQVCLFSKEPIGWRNRADITHPSEEIALQEFETAVRTLESLGIHVNVRSRIHEKVVIIDLGTVYDGSMNVMSYNPRFTSETMTRSVNAYKAICTIARLSLDSCSRCNHPPEADPAQLVLRKESLGTTVSSLRKNRGILQSTLAESLNTTRQNISQIETGKYYPSVDTLIDIVEALDCNLLIASKHAVPYVAETIRLIPNTDRATQKQLRGAPTAQTTFAPEANKASTLGTQNSVQAHTSQ